MENSKIEWTDHTFNAWVGCQALSAACDHCYAEAMVKRFGHDFAERRRTSEAYWRQPLKWNRDAAKAGVRRRVFCCSLADVFDNQVPQEWRGDLFALIDATPYLDWLLLTKRPQNIAKMMPAFFWDTGGADMEMVRPNVWIGTTVESPEEAARRIPHLRGVPAVVHFLSCEPLLAEIKPDLTDIDWVICGGESGPKRRPMDLAWARSLRDQCKAAGVPFFGKQLDKVQPLPDDLMVREFPACP